MNAAIYARKSTEQDGVREDVKSVTRQIEHAKAYAATKGWTVVDEHVYTDDGVSGAEFIKRPGLARLMSALAPRPPFDALIVSEESRLGREQIETAYCLKRIVEAGVRVFFYLEDRERRLDTASDKVMLSLANFAAEVERERASQRTHDALLRKARARHVTGGKVYGYDNCEVVSPMAPGGHGKRLYVERRINLDQATTVRRIFELYAQGLGITRIAKLLNTEGVMPPHSDGLGWAPTAIREMLYRPLYRGEIVWNRSQKISRGGTRRQRRRPEGEWLRLEAPELQIVPEKLWGLVQDRLAHNRTIFPRRRDGGLLGRSASPDGVSPYLLSGLGRCALCGGSFIAMTRSHGRARAHFYGCAYYQKRGAAVCTNNLVIRQDLLDHAVLDALREVFDDRIIDTAIRNALAHLRAGQGRHLDRRAAIERELSLIKTHERRLVDAIRRGDGLEPLIAALKAEEERKRALELELEGLGTLERVTSLDTPRVSKTLRSRVADVRALLSRHLPQARQMLRKLLVDRLELKPIEQRGRKGYHFKGLGSYGVLFEGGALPPTVVAPTGFEPVFQP